MAKLLHDNSPCGLYDVKNQKLISVTGSYVALTREFRRRMWEFKIVIRSIPAKPETMSDEDYAEVVANADVDYDEIELHYIHRHRSTYNEICKLFLYIYMGYSEDMAGANIISATCEVRPIPFQHYIANYGMHTSVPGLFEQDNCNIFYNTDLTVTENIALIGNENQDHWGM